MIGYSLMRMILPYLTFFFQFQLIYEFVLILTSAFLGVSAHRPGRHCTCRCWIFHNEGTSGRDLVCKFLQGTGAECEDFLLKDVFFWFLGVVAHEI